MKFPVPVRSLGLAGLALLLAQMAPSTVWGALPIAVLHSFSADQDGASPKAGVTAVGSTLYGTTSVFGGEGTVFKINMDGTGFQTLHNFLEAEGQQPNADLTLAGSTLFGTTFYGGSGLSLFGTLFSINVNGSGFSVVHPFAGSFTDGQHPQASLTPVGSTLYGTTSSGGSLVGGTIYSVGSDGSGYTVLRNFGAPGDGAFLYSGLTPVGSLLYGTTISAGGSSSLGGTIYRFDPSTATVSYPYVLTAATDGSQPEGNLTLLGSKLYGTTNQGGAFGKGTLFSFDLFTSQFTVLHNFASDANDGASPYAGVTLVGSTLYGTTQSGGTAADGTIFSFDTTNSSYQVVHNFTGTIDGYSPYSDLTPVGSTLYGTTWGGGQGNFGTVFALTVPEPQAWLLGLVGLAAFLVSRRRLMHDVNSKRP